MPTLRGRGGEGPLSQPPSIYADSIKSRETGEGTMAVLRVLHRASPLRFEILRSPCWGNPKPVVSDFSSSAPSRYSNGLRSERFPFWSLPCALIVRNSNVADDPEPPWNISTSFCFVTATSRAEERRVCRTKQGNL